MNADPIPGIKTDVVPYASNAPGSLGTPRPRKIPVLLPVTAAIATAGAAFLAIVGGSRNTCRGATRSAKLQWEQRQQEVNQTIAQATTARQGETNGG